jgi:hypothetical protein
MFTTGPLDGFLDFPDVFLGQQPILFYGLMGRSWEDLQETRGFLPKINGFL